MESARARPASLPPPAMPMVSPMSLTMSAIRCAAIASFPRLGTGWVAEDVPICGAAGEAPGVGAGEAGGVGPGVGATLMGVAYLLALAALVTTSHSLSPTRLGRSKLVGSYKIPWR